MKKINAEKVTASDKTVRPKQRCSNVYTLMMGQYINVLCISSDRYKIMILQCDTRMSFRKTKDCFWKQSKTVVKSYGTHLKIYECFLSCSEVFQNGSGSIWHISLRQKAIFKASNLILLNSCTMGNKLLISTVLAL